MDRKVDYIELLNSFESLKTLTTESLGILPLQSIEPENLKNELDKVNKLQDRKNFVKNFFM